MVPPRGSGRGPPKAAKRARNGIVCFVPRKMRRGVPPVVAFVWQKQREGPPAALSTTPDVVAAAPPHLNSRFEHSARYAIDRRRMHAHGVRTHARARPHPVHPRCSAPRYSWPALYPRQPRWRKIAMQIFLKPMISQRLSAPSTDQPREWAMCSRDQRLHAKARPYSGQRPLALSLV